MKESEGAKGRRRLRGLGEGKGSLKWKRRRKMIGIGRRKGGRKRGGRKAGRDE